MNPERDRAPEYRKHAQACLALSERMSPGLERAKLLYMAQQWLALAAKVENTNPYCPKCQVEMALFERKTVSGRPAMQVFECFLCGRLSACDPPRLVA
jgi:hypothetical protein